MKKTIIIVAILLIAVSLYTWQKSEAGITNQELGSTGSVDISSWKTYRNEKYGFSLQYPKNFFLLERSEDPWEKPGDNVIEITNYPIEYKGRGLTVVANFNLTLLTQFPNQTPSSFAAASGLPIQNLSVGTLPIQFVEYPDTVNHSGAGFKARYFIQNPQQQNSWIVVDHNPLMEGDEMVRVASSGILLTYAEQKKIVNNILSTFKFTK